MRVLGLRDLLEEIEELRAIAAQVHVEPPAEAHVYVHAEPDRLSTVDRCGGDEGASCAVGLDRPEDEGKLGIRLDGRRRVVHGDARANRRATLAAAPGDPLPDAIARRRGV